jgi:MerR family transcriptional regulator, thiopeptide resistance regulator
MNITQLGRQCGVSRGAILHYEASGLLKPERRSGSGYRQYGPRELEQLRQICQWRKAGLTVADIRSLLHAEARTERPVQEVSAADVLRRRYEEIGCQIAQLQRHQMAILAILKKHDPKGWQQMTKEKWTGIMQAAGLSEQDMQRWHTEFERAAPEEHEQFLRYLQIEPEEVARIRSWSSSGIAPEASPSGGTRSL